MKHLLTYKNICRSLLLLSLFSFPFVSIAQHPVIAEIIKKVSIDSLMNRAKEVTGGQEVMIKGVKSKISSRHKDFPGNELAFQYILEKLNGYGFTPETQAYGSTGKNAIAVQKGTVYPNKFFILCAHYDNMPAVSVAPGAEDNASGVVTVLEAIRILSKYQFEYSIIYAFWDEEEQGCLGSKAYAKKIFAEKKSIAGVINLDMLAYDGNGDNLSRIASKKIGNSYEISDSVVAVNTDHKLGLKFIARTPLVSGNSDQASFWEKGYGAVHLIGDFEDDRTPHYHKATDNMSDFNLPFFEKMAKLTIGSIAALAIPSKTVGFEDATDLLSLTFHPNPTSDVLMIQGSNGILVDAKITVFNILGKQMMTLNGESDHINLDLSSYINGMYFININTGKGITTKKIIVAKN